MLQRYRREYDGSGPTSPVRGERHDDQYVMNPFDIASPQYARVRPAYPSGVVDHVLGVAGASHGCEIRRVADIGAGTGKMTLLLAARGLQVEAVEPSEAMRAQLHVAISDPTVSPVTGRICVHDAAGEDTGLSDGDVDLVVYAQSWHWVDEERASAEAHRILADGGVLAAVWNQMDVSVPWVHRLTRIMRSGDVHRPDTPPAFGPFFTEPLLHMSVWKDALTPEQILRLGTTRSSYLRQDDAGRERMQNNLRWYLYEHLSGSPGELIRIPYTTLVWTAGRK